MHTLDLRSFLWFTTGVVLTIVSVATFGAWRADAAVVAGESTFVPVTPCRLFDTRPGEAVPGSITTPIGPETIRTQQVTGAVGNCNIPTDASAVAFNITILNPSAAGVLTLFPADVVTKPSASNLNWVAGQAPTPNKVDVKLSPTGAVKLGNGSGTVDVVGDIVGYYTSSTVAQLRADLDLLGSLFGSLATAQINQQASIDALLTDTNVIPSGTTVSGMGFHQRTRGALDGGVPFDDFVFVELPGRTASDLDQSNVVFSDVDPDCDGDWFDPTAPAGKVCVYLELPEGIGELSLDGFANDQARSMFVIRLRPTGAIGVDEFMSVAYSWAYTAP